MIILTQKQFDLLEEIANHIPSEKEPFKQVSTRNTSLEGLITQELVEIRPKEGCVLILEAAITQIGYRVVNNEIAHEITISDETEQKEENKMSELQNATETGCGYQLEDNIPIPEITQIRKQREDTMPLDRMTVGQSFLVPFKEGEDKYKGRKRVAACVSQTRKRKLGADSTAQFITAIVENGYRVWRKA